MSYTYEYPRPALTVDCVVFLKDNTDLKVLLIKRKYPPFEGKWAFPGGFVDMDETLE
ncbi:MAG: NUDIX hydrolase, partial [Bacteroidetes bacterium]|nr:NUDIX hydrolase [Bacteroidota bacterium]